MNTFLKIKRSIFFKNTKRKELLVEIKIPFKKCSKKVKKNWDYFLSCSNFSPLFQYTFQEQPQLSEENLFLKNCINTREKKLKKIFVYYIHTTILLSSTYKFEYRLHYRINNETEKQNERLLQGASKSFGFKKKISKLEFWFFFCRKNSSKRRSKNVNKLSRIFLMLFEIMEISKTFQYILYLNFRAKNSSKRCLHHCLARM